LRDKGYHPWVDLTFGAAKSIGLLATRRKYPLWNYYDSLKGFFTFSDSSKAINQRLQFFKLVTEKVQDRIDLGVDVRPDFMSHILRNNGVGEKGLSFPEMVANSALLMVAGSETTATLLSGATYLVLSNPRVYKELTKAIRSHFSDPSQITINEVVKVPYLIAVLQESLRYYPPVPTGYPRVVPKGGDKISGHHFPEGTSVYVSQHASNHSTRNFTEPDEFVPERWLEDREEKYADDKRQIVQPFLIGPRNCLGKK
jgi:cytochrome P450